MGNSVAIVGAGLAGSEAALVLARLGVSVDLYEMRPVKPTPIHQTNYCAELVCSNSLKSTKPETAAGMLKAELAALDSPLLAAAKVHEVPAGGALAVDRDNFASSVTKAIEESSIITLMNKEVCSVDELAENYDAIILATGPLTSDGLAEDLTALTGEDSLAFYDAAAPIVLADSLDHDKLFRQSRYEDAHPDAEAAQGTGGGANSGAATPQGDYLNAPFSREEYDRFIEELLSAKKTILHDFESKDLFQACQPIEEIAKSGKDAPRFGPLKPVGLTDPSTGRRPWAALQLRAENRAGTAFNLVGFQTNLTFPEQKRVFSMIPGLENAEFVRYGVMHRNTFLNAPRCLNRELQLTTPAALALQAPIYVAGQLGGTEGYCEAIRSGHHCALQVAARLSEVTIPAPPITSAFGSLLAHATNPETANYQPMHVNFGIFQPLDNPIRNKRQRYEAYASRGAKDFTTYTAALREKDLLKDDE